MRKSPTVQRNDIQGLRAIAVGTVVAGHAGLIGFSGGFVGVDVFFVISGYLITSLLVRDLSSGGGLNLVVFYARRARRILPATTVLLVTVLAAMAFLKPTAEFESATTDAWWSLGFMANIHFANVGTDYFAQSDFTSPFQHFWSLAVEEQFYVVWPIVIALIFKWKRARWVIAAALAVISLAWSIRGVNVDATLAYFSTFGRAWELLAGALLAMAGHAIMRVGPRLRDVLGVAGLIGLAFAVLTYDDATLFPGATALVPVLATVALLIAGADPARPSVASRLLGLQPLRYIGDISFSLYLWHWPVLVLTEWRAVVAIPVSFALAMASYHFVEEPFRKGSFFKPTRRSIALWPVSVLVPALVITGGSAWAQSRDDRDAELRATWFERNPKMVQTVTDGEFEPAKAIKRALKIADAGAPLPSDLDLEAIANDRSSLTSECLTDEPETSSELCPVGDLDSDTTVVLWGDSHANIWVDPLDTIGKREGIKVLPLIKLGCAPFDVPQLNVDGVTHYDECDQWRDWSFDQIEELSPDGIVMGYRGLLLVDTEEGESRTELWKEGVETTMEQIDELPAEVSVIGDWTTRKITVTECVGDSDALQADCVTKPRGDGPKSSRITRPIVEEYDADWVSTDDLTCVDGRCPLFVGDVPVYRDNDHLSSTWAGLNTTWLQDELTPMLDAVDE